LQIENSKNKTSPLKCVIDLVLGKQSVAILYRSFDEKGNFVETQWNYKQKCVNVHVLGWIYAGIVAL